VGSVLIGVSLARSSLSGTQVGVVFACILLGAALASVAVGRFGDRLDRGRAYCSSSWRSRARPSRSRTACRCCSSPR
jgi:hypothetical protein